MAWHAQAMKADTLRNGRQLTYGSYKDCSRPLRRCLKQLGSGSIEGGFNAVKTDNKALEEIATLVDIEKQVTMPSACVICTTYACVTLGWQPPSIHPCHWPWVDQQETAKVDCTKCGCHCCMLMQVVLREAENAGHTLDIESKSSASDVTSPMSPAVSTANSNLSCGTYLQALSTVFCTSE